MRNVTNTPAVEQWRLKALLQYSDLTRGGAVLLQVRLPPSPHLPNPALLVRAATSPPRRRTANWLDAHNKSSPQDSFSNPIWETRGGSASVNTAESRAFLNWGCFKCDSAQQTTWVLCVCDCVCACVFECVFGGEWRREGRAPIWNACVCASCVTVSLSLSDWPGARFFTCMNDLAIVIDISLTRFPWRSNLSLLPWGLRLVPAGVKTFQDKVRHKQKIKQI